MHKRINGLMLSFALSFPLALLGIGQAMAATTCGSGDPPPCISCTTQKDDSGQVTTTCNKSNFTQGFYNMTIQNPTFGTNVIYKFCKAVADTVSSPVTYYYQQTCDNTMSGIRLTTAQNEHYPPSTGNWRCDDPNSTQCTCKGNNPATDCPFTNKPF